MPEVYSLKEIVEDGFNMLQVWIDQIHERELPFNYQLSIQNNLYQPEFSIYDHTRLKPIVEELIMNSLKAHFQVGELKNIFRQEYDRAIFKAKVPSIEIGLTIENDKYHITGQDNGPGIPIEIQDRIWTPGFSTRGTLGLGLIALKQQVENYQGSVSCTSTPNVNTTFSIYLPINSLKQ